MFKHVIHHPNRSHPSSVTERVVVIHDLKDTVLILTGNPEVTDCLSNYFSSGMFIWLCLFQKNSSSYAFFQSTGITYTENLQSSIFSVAQYTFLTLKFETTHFCQGTFFQRI